MSARYVQATFAIAEEDTDLAMGTLVGYPIQGVEVVEDVTIVTFEQNDWQEDFAELISAEVRSCGIGCELVSVATQDDRNWNEEWEASIDPVVVNDNIVIVPHWKQDQVNAELKLIISPKMSFGTGHHATTRMMCRLLETRVQQYSSWIDVGTGTGVLAILAAKLGATSVLAFDNDEWSIVNAQENVERNDCSAVVSVMQASVGSIVLPKSDGLAANLYKHLVIPFAGEFIAAVPKGAPIILSGILQYDALEIIETFQKLGCVLDERLDENEWCALALLTNGGVRE